MIKNGDDHKSIFEYLKTLSPSGVELELISLASFEFEKGPNSSALQPNAILEKMMQIFVDAVEANTDCDFVQAVLNNFLKNHYDVIVEDTDLGNMLNEIKVKLEGRFNQLEHLINSNLCMTQFFAGINNF